MYTEKEFKTRWQELHHPTMNVDDDVSFYYGAYKQLYEIAKRSAWKMNEYYLLKLVLLVEDGAFACIDCTYEAMYRSVGCMDAYLCNKLGMPNYTGLTYDTISKAIAKAPESSMRLWIKECVLSGDFQRLKDVASYFAIKDYTVRRIYPNLKFRKAAFLELADGDKEKAKEMLESDLAFNWHDKEGCTLLSRIAESFKRYEDGKEVIANLKTVKPLPLDSYQPLEMKDGGRTVTIMKKDNTVLDVIFRSCVSKKKIDEMSFVGQLVSYLGKNYVNGPVVWLDASDFDLWDSDVFWNSIYENEEESSKHEYFTTVYGKKYTRHQDLYGEFETDGNGFYTDEPNIFDFLDWLTQEKSHSKQ